MQYAAPRLTLVCFDLLLLGRSLCWEDPPAAPSTPLRADPQATGGCFSLSWHCVGKADFSLFGFS